MLEKIIAVFRKPLSTEESDAIKPIAEGLSSAVYRQLDKSFNGTLYGYNRVNAWLNQVSVNQLDEEQAEIYRVRSWVKTISDSEVRSEFNQWLDNFYQHGLNEAREEVITQAQKKHMEKYDYENRIRHTEANKLIDNGVVPTVPRRT